MRTSEAGLDLIKQFEGFSPVAYYCPGGRLTIGYGDTLDVIEGQTITEEDADARLRARVIEFENCVERYVAEHLSQNEFDALVSLAYNIGTANFAKSSVVRFLNAGARRKAGDSFLRWNKIRKNGKLEESVGLTRRRKAERELFLTT